MHKRMNVILKYLLGAAAGGGLGFLYYRVVGCRSGTCPLTSTIYGSVLYGTVLGTLVVGILAR